MMKIVNFYFMEMVNLNNQTGRSVWGGQAFGGYAGLKHTAEIIAEYIPNSIIYVEPFAGLGRLMGLIKADKIILNDLSEYANNHNKKYNAVITDLDFIECINQNDSKDTFFLIDPPYSNNVYKLNEKCFIDRDYRDYYRQLADLLPKIKGNWILCIDERNYHRFVKSLFPKYDSLNIKSKKNSLFGLKANIRLISNKPLIKQGIRQVTLENRE